MSADAYELLALTMRYVFAALMLLIVLRAARGAIADSRRAAKLRRLSPMTGICGELVVLDPLPKLPRGMRYPVIREGMIGTSRRADVRIRNNTVRRRHLLFQLTESGLHLRTHAGARMRDAQGEPVRELMLLDGDSFYIGNVHLLLVLSVPELARQPHPAPSQEDALFEADDWDLPQSPMRAPKRSAAMEQEAISPILAHRASTAADSFDRAAVRPTERTADPFDADPFEEDPISPILARKSARERTPWAKPRSSGKRAFLEEDDLFHTDDDF